MRLDYVQHSEELTTIIAVLENGMFQRPQLAECGQVALELRCRLSEPSMPLTKEPKIAGSVFGALFERAQGVKSDWTYQFTIHYIHHTMMVPKEKRKENSLLSWLVHGAWTASVYLGSGSVAEQRQSSQKSRKGILCSLCHGLETWDFFYSP